MTVQSTTPSLGSAYALKCRECGATTELDASYACIECFGPLEVAYAPATLTVSRAFLREAPDSVSRAVFVSLVGGLSFSARVWFHHLQ